MECFKGKSTFASFVVGKTNENAYLAAKTIVNNPGTVMNPVFIYGESGVGKTHLLNAVENEIKSAYPDKNVLYMNSETITGELITILRDKMTVWESAMEWFRRNYSDVDFLLVDDIQFLKGKDSTQKEVFQMLKDVCLQGTQIIICSDEQPKDLTILHNGLTTAFEKYIAIQIELPDYETRKAILVKKMKDLHYEEYEIKENLLDYLAENITGSVRELEGALHKAAAYNRLNDRRATIAEDRDIAGCDAENGRQ